MRNFSPPTSTCGHRYFEDNWWVRRKHKGIRTDRSVGSNKSGHRVGGGKADHARVGEAKAATYLVFLCARHGVGHGIVHENVHCNIIIAFTNS